MRKAIPAIVVFVLTATSLSAQIKPNDLAQFAGRWKGELIYKDYTSGKQTHIPVEVIVTHVAGKAGAWNVAFQYPDEPHANSSAVYALDADGTTWRGHKMISNVARNGKRKLVTEHPGQDDEKPCTIRETVEVNSSNLICTQEVRYIGTKDWFVRHQYVLQRQQ